MARGPQDPGPDLRLVLPALGAWLSAAWVVGLPSRSAAITVVLLAAAGIMVSRLGMRLLSVALLVAATAGVIAALRVAGVASGPIAALADEGAQVEIEFVVTSDPRLREGRFEPVVLFEARAERVTGRGRTTAVRSPLLVIADPGWLDVRFGSRIDAEGRLGVPQSTDLSAVFAVRGDPEVVSQPSAVNRFVSRLRVGLRAAAAGLGPVERVLVPALVDGDDADMPETAVEEFRVCGLTHLLAVSGANLTLVLSFIVLVGRRCGVRAHGLTALGVFGVVGFVLLARPEPSVLRAAAMGVVALAGLTAGSRRRGVRALCVAVLVLVLLDPWLARSVGFLLSSLATAGILVLAPPWRDAMNGWMPRWLAESLAIPMAAQLVCTPVLAVIAGQVSVVSVVANLAAAPAVGPATVLGLVSCLVSPASSTLAAFFAHLAGAAAWWIATVAHVGAALPGAALPWPIGARGVVLLVVFSLAATVVAPRLLSRRYRSLGVVAVMAVVLVRPPGLAGWPPDGWVMVVCDVGQGDGLVLNAGDGRGVVVDTGPDPALMDRCLDRLGIHSVPLVVLTHFHADHVEGLPGVLRGRSVGEVEVGPLPDPASEAVAVLRWTRSAGVPVTLVSYGETRQIGDLQWTVIGPVPGFDPGTESEDGGSPPNNASIVMLVQVHGIRILLTGDVEPPAQRAILDSGVDVAADVLKVPHHGSSHQDPEFIAACGAALAVVSVGVDNDYGHPAGNTLALLNRLGAVTRRTDQDGSIAVVQTSAGLAVRTLP
jgi:competence protein ComEC